MKTPALALSLVSLLAACGSSRTANTPCQALSECCASLPSAARGSCGSVATSTDSAACTAALRSLQSASSCQHVTVPKDQPSTGSTSDPCGRYLACLVIAEPSAYAAALPLYGKDSACWSTPSQSKGCDQACDTSFATIEYACECQGATCTACNAPAADTYRDQGDSEIDAPCANDEFIVSQAQLVHGTGKTATLELTTSSGGGYSGDTVQLTGELSCSGASTFAATSSDGYGCTDTWSATVTPTSDDKVLAFAVTSTYSCPDSDTGTCTHHVKLSKGY